MTASYAQAGESLKTGIWWVYNRCLGSPKSIQLVLGFGTSVKVQNFKLFCNMKRAVFKSTGSMKREAGGLLLSYMNMSMGLSFLQIILQQNGAVTHTIRGRLTMEHKICP
jgi:hypothetical protein